MFKKRLAKALNRSDGAKGGCLYHPFLIIFKIFVRTAPCDLSDDQVEYEINDRLLLMQFICGLVGWTR